MRVVIYFLVGMIIVWNFFLQAFLDCNNEIQMKTNLKTNNKKSLKSNENKTCMILLALFRITFMNFSESIIDCLILYLYVSIT